MLLCASGADVAAARSAAEAVAAPVRVLDATALPDSGAGLAEAGLAAPGEVWVIRPELAWVQRAAMGQRHRRPSLRRPPRHRPRLMRFGRRFRQVMATG